MFSNRQTRGPVLNFSLKSFFSSSWVFLVAATNFIFCKPGFRGHYAPSNSGQALCQIRRCQRHRRLPIPTALPLPALVLPELRILPELDQARLLPPRRLARTSGEQHTSTLASAKTRRASHKKGDRPFGAQPRHKGQATPRPQYDKPHTQPASPKAPP